MTDPPRMGLCLLALCWVPPPALAQADLEPAYAGKFMNFSSPPSASPGPSDIVHVAPPTGQTDSDRTSILAALEQARPGDAATMGVSIEILRELDSYRPEYLRNEEARLRVPALTFVNNEGKTRGLEHFNPLLMTAEQVVREGGGFIPDTLARSYFERLARDSVLQAQARTFWEEVAVPGAAAEQAAFYRAFGDHLLRYTHDAHGGDPSVPSSFGSQVLRGSTE